MNMRNVGSSPEQTDLDKKQKMLRENVKTRMTPEDYCALVAEVFKPGRLYESSGVWVGAGNNDWNYIISPPSYLSDFGANEYLFEAKTLSFRLGVKSHKYTRNIWLYIRVIHNPIEMG